MLSKKKLLIITIVSIVILFIILLTNKNSTEIKDNENVYTTEESDILDNPFFNNSQEPPILESTSIEKIENAYENNEIDLDKYLTLLTIATFDHNNIPSEYKGAIEREFGTQLLHMIDENFDKLNSETQEALLPFILSPDNPDSYWYEEEKPSVLSKLQIIPAVIAMTTPRSDGSKYLIKNTGDVKNTQYVKDGFNDAYKAYVKLGYKEPTDWIYFELKNLTNNNGEEFMKEMQGKNRCIIFIDLNQQKDKMKSTVAHELFHCFQEYIPLKSYTDDAWIWESTATWAEDHVYPKLNTEHEWDPNIFRTFSSEFFDTSKGREYGSYLWWFFLDQENGKTGQIVKELLDSAGKLGQKEAIKKIPMLNAEMKEYALWNLNEPPFKMYQDANSMPIYHPAGQSIKHNYLYNKEKRDYDVILMEGSIMYYTFPIRNSKIDRFKADLSKINTKEYPKNGIQMVYKIGSTLYYEDVSNQNEVVFCRTRPSERVSIVIFIVSNSDLDDFIAEDIGIDTTGKCNPEWSGITEIKWNFDFTKDLSDQIISGDPATGFFKEDGYVLSREKLVYDEEYDEFFVTEQHFTYKFDDLQLINYDRECSFIWEKDQSKTFGSATSKWDFKDAYSTDAPTKFYRDEEDTPYEYQTLLIVNPDSNFLQGGSESSYMKIDCGFDGFMVTPTPVIEKQVFDSPTSLPSLDDVVITMSKSEKTLRGNGQLIRYNGDQPVYFNYVVDYSYG